MVWYPSVLCVVVGQSGKLERSILLDAVIRDGLPVYRRPSGGEAVLLSPDTLVISAIITETDFRSPLIYFRIFNQLVKESLESLGIHRLEYRGISDIAIGEKKILGSAIYRTQRKIFYHAVLNVAMPNSAIAAYLSHPQKEPDYRRGRPHDQFVTSLHAEGYLLDRKVVGKTMASYLIEAGLRNEGDTADAVSPSAI